MLGTPEKEKLTKKAVGQLLVSAGQPPSRVPLCSSWEGSACARVQKVLCMVLGDSDLSP